MFVRGVLRRSFCLLSGVTGVEVAPNVAGITTGFVVQHQPGQTVAVPDGSRQQQVIAIQQQPSQLVLGVSGDGSQQQQHVVNIHIHQHAAQQQPGPGGQIRPWNPGEVPPERECPQCWLLPEVVCCACPFCAFTLRCGFPDCLTSKCFCKILTCECLRIFVYEKRCTCCECQKQFCCYDSRCACPPSPQIPCLCTLFCPFLLVAPKCGCCVTIHDAWDLDRYPGRAYVMPGNVDPRFLYILCACCCYSENCYCKCPDCICSESEYCACCCCREEGYCKLFATDTQLKCLEAEFRCDCFKIHLSIPPNRNQIAYCAPFPFYVMSPETSKGCCIKYKDGQPLCITPQGDNQTDDDGAELQLHQPQAQQADEDAPAPVIAKAT